LGVQSLGTESQNGNSGFYVAAQFLGGFAGVLLISTVLRDSFRRPPVYYVATLPGPAGSGLAFVAEVLISFGMMGTVLIVSNTKALARYTGLFAGLLLFSFITWEAPLSGMSMNPARSMSSAALPGAWAGLWIYFSAPILGMFLAADVNKLLRGRHSVFCAKLNHETARRCIFCSSRSLAPRVSKRLT
jgi:aquaporin Z